jgi:ankyrin repeat protein
MNRRIGLRALRNAALLAPALAWAQADPALLEAAAAGDVTAVQAELQQGANVNAHGSAGQTPLMAAAVRGNTQVLDVLLAAGADLEAKGTPNFTVVRANFQAQLGDCYTALTLAAATGRHRAAEFLLARGAKIDCARRGLLSLAIMGPRQETDEQVALVSWLLEQETATPFDRTMAYFSGHARTQALLGATSLDASDRDVAAAYAIWELALTKGYRRVLRSVGDADVWDAAGVGDTQRVAALLDTGISVDARTDASGQTPLMHAVLDDDPARGVATVSFLLARGADVNAATDTRKTALMYAASRRAAGSGPLISALLAAGAKRELKDQDGKDAATMARDAKNAEASALLRAKR